MYFDNLIYFMPMVFKNVYVCNLCILFKKRRKEDVVYVNCFFSFALVFYIIALFCLVFLDYLSI